MTYADHSRKYRERAHAAHGKLKRYKKTLFEKGVFVAVDGEGFSDGEVIREVVGDRATVYEGVDHRYGLLMDSAGGEIVPNPGEVRLSTKQCLDFLLDIPNRVRNAIPVIFGGTYDVTHMLGFSLGRDEVRALLRDDGSLSRRTLDIDLPGSPDGGSRYRLEWRPRKSFSIWRFRRDAPSYRAHTKADGGTQWKLNYEARVVLWDVWGFFQGTFLAAMENWLPGDPDWHFIRDMKGARNMFERSEIDTIRKYTSAELRCLVAMMERVRTATASLGLSISRWDGAGSIAGAFFKRNNVKSHMAAAPPDVFDAARIAYSGGHIEAMSIGHHRGKVYHYDINSAYPHQFRRLPSLARGEWCTGEGVPPPGFTLVRIEFHFTAGLPFYPLFWRTGNGSILYPERGAGWYWFEEYDAAREFAARFGAYEFRVAGWHHFQPTSNAFPFSWVEEAYQVRRDVIMRARETGVRDDSHMMIKLGLNSCYGKTAQQVGVRYEQGEIVPPAYFQIEWAGAVTAGCRAQLMRAAMQAPDSIISFATDAIYATAPLSLQCGPEKRLGEWEAHGHFGMTMVMPGVYWTHESDGSVTHFSRGFDKQEMADCQFIHDAWRKGLTSVRVKQRRMITLGQAMMSEHFWNMRGLFVETTRELVINGLNSKRYPVAMTQVRPHRELCRTRPQGLREDAGQSLASLMSTPYSIKWMEAPETNEDFDTSFLDDVETVDRSFLA
jgi:DNA polymerase family B